LFLLDVFSHALLHKHLGEVMRNEPLAAGRMKKSLTVARSNAMRYEKPNRVEFFHGRFRILALDCPPVVNVPGVQSERFPAASLLANR
jgi:hypothetical protein